MQVTPRVRAVRVPFQIPVRPDFLLERFVYAFLVRAQEGVWLIDTAVASAERAILAEIAEMGLEACDIRGILLTHAHPDHIGALKPLKAAAAGCVVAAHVDEIPWIENVERQKAERPTPGFDRLVAGGVPVDRALADGDSIELGGGERLEVIHTPGHSRGSISFFLPGEGTLIAGDAVPVPGDIPIYEDAAACVRSIRRLRALEGVQTLLSSWDKPRADGPEAICARLDDALAWLRRIHAAALGAVARGGDPATPAFAVGVLRDLGLPENAANSLVARTFLSHLQSRAAAELTSPGRL